MNDDTHDITTELDVLQREFGFILKDEIPVTFEDLSSQINLIQQYLVKSNDRNKNSLSRADRLNLIPQQCGMEGIKCTLTLNAFELSNIEINYKPSQRHNNYIYKSKDDCAWHLHQISNCADTLKALVSYMANLTLPFVSQEQAMFHVERLLEYVNSARNVLLFPRKRSLAELQSQKNMKIFPLVPNDLVFSFYVQGFKLFLAIYVVKGNETSRYPLECSSINWLNNVMILLTSCLQKLQQLKDKLIIFNKLELAEDHYENQTEQDETQSKNKYKSDVIFENDDDEDDESDLDRVEMKLKELESHLQQVDSFENAKLNFEQYITTPHLASNILFTIANQYDDIENKIVCDMGCGTGMLSIGCALLDAAIVYGIDIDPDALGTCKNNINYFELNNVELINADCKQLLRFSETNDLFNGQKFDTIVMNPPFGTKYQEKLANNIENSKFGIDMQFLKLASRLCTNSIYSLNKTVTRDYIRKFSSKLGLEMDVVSELRYNIPKVDHQNKRASARQSKPEMDIEVDFLRFEFV